jgi:hypothetical protein
MTAVSTELSPSWRTHKGRERSSKARSNLSRLRARAVAQWTRSRQRGLLCLSDSTSRSRPEVISIVTDGGDGRNDSSSRLLLTVTTNNVAGGQILPPLPPLLDPQGKTATTLNALQTRGLFADGPQVSRALPTALFSIIALLLATFSTVITEQ